MPLLDNLELFCENKVVFKCYFLPVGVLLALALGLFDQGSAGSLLQFEYSGLTPKTVAILVIFLCTGYLLDLREVKFTRKLLLALGGTVLLNLGVGPLIGWLILTLGNFPPAVVVGIAVFASVPTTLSSAIVITRVAGGNVLWAITMTATLNIVGLLVMPLTIGFLLSHESDFDFDRLAMFLQICLLVIVPLLVGMGIHRLLKGRQQEFLTYVPPFCIIAIVWMSVSAENEKVWTLSLVTVLTLLLVSCLLHFGLLASATLFGWLAKFDPKQRIAFLFATSQKTLPVAISVVAILGSTTQATAEFMALANVTCLVIYFPQILIDSTIASIITKKMPKMSQK